MEKCSVRVVLLTTTSNDRQNVQPALDFFACTRVEWRGLRQNCSHKWAAPAGNSPLPTHDHGDAEEDVEGNALDVGKESEK